MVRICHCGGTSLFQTSEMKTSLIRMLLLSLEKRGFFDSVVGLLMHTRIEYNIFCMCAVDHFLLFCC